MSIAPSAVKYVADLAGVAEVSLWGTADLTFWRDRLFPEDLVPVDFHGCAQVVLTTTSARFKGIRFRELSIAVSAREMGADGRAGLFLPQAFNSSRVFAWFERTLFATPYCHAKIEVDVNLPARIVAFASEELVLEARMGGVNAPRLISTAPAASRVILRSGLEKWCGPIFLPRDGKGGRVPGQLFFAHLEGRTESYPFSEKHDVVAMNPTSRWPAVRWLAESHFAPCEWAIRANARHARSKTFSRRAT